MTAAGVARGSIYLSLQSVSATVIGVLGFAYMARMISQEAMGVVAGLTLLHSLVLLASDVGLNASVLKFVSELRGRDEPIAPLVLSTLLFRIPVSLVFASALFLFAPAISLGLFKTPTYAGAVKLLAVDAALMSVALLLNRVLWGCGKLRTMAVYGVVSNAVRWLSIAALLTSGSGVGGIVLGWLIGDTVLLLALAWTAVTLVAPRQSVNLAAQLTRLLRFSWPLYLASVVSFAYTWYDRALILAYLPLAELGIYNIAYTAFSVLASIATPLGSALLPYYGMAYGRNDQQAISFGIKRASKYTMLTIFPLALGLAATARPVLTVFAGPQYAQGWPFLTLLALFGLLYGLFPPFSNLLLIFGKTRTILLMSVIPVALSVALLPLLWTLHLTGLAMIRGTSLLLSFIVTILVLSKTEQLTIAIDRLELLRILFASVLMAGAVTVLQQFLSHSLLLPVDVLVGGAVYVALIRILVAFGDDDYELLQQLLGENAARYVARILGFPRRHLEPTN